MTTIETVEREQVAWFSHQFATLGTNIERVIQGKRSVIDLIVTCLISEGHALIEDVPGVGKTLLAKSLARSIESDFQRIQFTPDLLPSDITGVSVWNRGSGEFEFKPGAIFANIVVGDEINRASPKTQSALLEAMEERQVTVDGTTRPLPPPFMVVATQNPLEHEGTYPLPEAQLDRFMMRLTIGYPSREKGLEILDAHGIRSMYESLTPVISDADVMRMVEIARQVHVSQAVKGYIIDVVEATRHHDEVLLGASPRSALFLQRVGRTKAASEARDFVSPDDIKTVVEPVLAHRMALRPEAQMRGTTIREILESVLRQIPVPGSRTNS